MSDLTNQEKLEEIYHLTVENNHLLHGMRNRERVANAFRIFYWLIIIGSILGAYIYVKPVLEVLMANKSRMDQTLLQFDELQKQVGGNFFQQAMNKLRGGMGTTTNGQ